MTRNGQVDSRERDDVVVVGTGPAGLSAALMHGRARRSVLVIPTAMTDSQAGL